MCVLHFGVYTLYYKILVYIFILLTFLLLLETTKHSMIHDFDIINFKIICILVLCLRLHKHMFYLR